MSAKPEQVLPANAPLPAHTLACPYCGGEQFTDGEAAAYGTLRFAPRLPGGRRPGAKPVHARMCNQCGNLQFFVPLAARPG